MVQKQIRCTHCEKPARLVSGITIYPGRQDLAKNYYWYCKPCGAYVGCHPDSIKALGTLANKDLRRMRKKAHDAFDPLWRDGSLTRRQAYFELSQYLNISVYKCHIGMFTIRDCIKVLKFVEEIKAEASAGV